MRVPAYAGWFLFLLALPAAAGPPNLAYIDLGLGGTACCLVPDGAGNMYVIGSVVENSHARVSVTKLDAANRVIGGFTFGGAGPDEPHAAALDAQGNLVIAGETRSADFPLVNPLIAQTEPGAPAGFVASVNPSSGRILFSTRIGGIALEPNFFVGTSAHAVTLDSEGNIYVAGQTNARDFPASANAFQKTGAGGDGFGTRPFGFVMKISGSGDRLLYSTLLGGANVSCMGGSRCIGRYTYTAIWVIAVDREGRATVGGQTNALDFPTTTGVFQAECRCREYANNGFVTRLNADGSGLVWSTFLGGSSYGASNLPTGVSVVTALALDAAGSVLVGGRTDADDFPVTTGALQNKFGGPVNVSRRPTDGFVAKLNASGTALLFSTYLGGSAEDKIADFSISAHGEIWLTGTTTSADFPGTAMPLAGSFITAVSPDGARLLRSYKTPGRGSGQSIRGTPNGDIWALGELGSVLEIPGGEVQGLGVFGVTSSAGQDVKGYVAPGEFVTLYGNLPGPASGAGAVLDADGRVASELAGVRVLFDGIPAPLLYVSSNQINVLAPYGLSFRDWTTVEVIWAGRRLPAVPMYVRQAQPEVFRNGFVAVALNQDGTLNSRANPAEQGSIVTFWASGAGLLRDQLEEGSVASMPDYPLPVLSIAVRHEGRSVEVLYAGPSPGMVIHALQINMRLPQSSFGTFQYFQLMAGGYISDYFAIAVK